MSKNQPRTPSYRLHKPTGLAVATVSGKDVYLGTYGTPESRAEYDRVVAEWLANGRCPTQEDRATPISVNEVLLAYVDYAEAYYLQDGQPTKELLHIKSIVRHVRELFGPTPAREFGPLRLKAVRERFIGLGHCRKNVNAGVQRVKRIFKWATSQELVEASVWHALQSVEGLRYGRSPAPESSPVRPVPDVYVEAVIKRVLPEVAAMIRLQRITGMRSGEITTMRTCDIDTTDDVWCYRPERHKTQHHGHTREVWLGPRAQEILRSWLRPNLQEYLFSPRRALQNRYAGCPTHRHQPARKPKTKKRLGDVYKVTAYYRAVRAAVDKINSEIRQRNAETDGKEPEMPYWHPHQLRHNAATDIRRQYGLEVARAVLGQTTLQAAQIYAEMDRNAACSVMAKIG